jgi:pimeloyl-ACP methyl ester carboxylesterase
MPPLPELSGVRHAETHRVICPHLRGLGWSGQAELVIDRARAWFA